MRVETWRRLQIVFVPPLVIGFAIVTLSYFRGDDVTESPLFTVVLVGNAAYQIARWHFNGKVEDG